MDRSFKNNADFKMNQQNFKLSDFGIDIKPNRDMKVARYVQNTCGFTEFKVRPLAAESSSRVRGNINGLEAAPSPESISVTQSPNVFWMQYAGQESGVIIVIINVSLKVARKSYWNGWNVEEDLIRESSKWKRGKSRQIFFILIGFNSTQSNSCIALNSKVVFLSRNVKFSRFCNKSQLLTFFFFTLKITSQIFHKLIFIQSGPSKILNLNPL